MERARGEADDPNVRLGGCALGRQQAQHLQQLGRHHPGAVPRVWTADPGADAADLDAGAVDARADAGAIDALALCSLRRRRVVDLGRLLAKL
jgi:hypothetical protein